MVGSMRIVASSPFFIVTYFSDSGSSIAPVPRPASIEFSITRSSTREHSAARHILASSGRSA